MLSSIASREREVEQFIKLQTSSIARLGDQDMVENVTKHLIWHRSLLCGGGATKWKKLWIQTFLRPPP